jgi:hypothetical protein
MPQSRALRGWRPYALGAGSNSCAGPYPLTIPLQPDPPASAIGRGTQYAYGQILERHGLMPGMQRVVGYLKADEARHLAYEAAFGGDEPVP